jgi:RNA-directed DNA polymerase
VSARLRARTISQADGLDKTRALQRVLYRSAKSDPGRRFHALFDHVARGDILRRAWEDVRANRGAPGVDGLSIAEVEDAGVGSFLQDLSDQLRSGSYRPAPLRRVYIPKAGESAHDASRPLSIPTVADRVVMAAAKIVLEPIFEADFAPVSFGFRPKRSAIDACEVVRKAANRAGNWVLDADVSNCFGSIDHDALMARVGLRVADRRMLRLLRTWLRAGVLEGGVMTDTMSGTPQGSPVSPLLANVALHVLDEAWGSSGRRLGVLVRYADDFVIVCPTQDRAEQARRRVAAVLAPLGLHLHPDKTRIVDLRRGAEGFDFLGFHHHKVESWRWRGRWYLRRWPSVRAMRSIRTKVKAATHQRFVGHDWSVVVGNLNRILRGWGAYFCNGSSGRKFSIIDSYVHERLAILASRKHGIPGRNWVSRFDGAWLSRLNVYRLSGRVRWVKAHA